MQQYLFHSYNSGGFFPPYEGRERRRSYKVTKTSGSGKNMRIITSGAMCSICVQLCTVVWLPLYPPPPSPPLPPRAALFILIINNALLCSLLHLSPVVTSMLLNKLWTPPVQPAASPLICPSPTLSLSLWWVCLFVHLFVCLPASSNFTPPAHTWLHCRRLTEIQLIL